MVEKETSSLKSTIPPRSVASIYNPDLLSKEQLIDSFVVRKKKFDKLYEEIRSAKMVHPEQHILIIGLRGMGKTSLLLRLSYETENDESLQSWLIPVVFNEEEYGITRLFKFWETIAQYLEGKSSHFTGIFNRMDEAYELIRKDDAYEQAAFEILIQSLRKVGKKILLFIDNFGDMFKRFSKQEKQRLREVLTTCPDLRIIAGSSVAAESFFKTDDPLYELFKIEQLTGLNREETAQLLLKLGEHYPENPIKEILQHQSQRVETLRRLTDGNPRSIVMLFEIFVDDKNGKAFTDLESILDRVTPLYKHRMDDLSPQQQEIMSVLALNWDAISAKEIAFKTRLSSKQVSAQLKQLSQNNLVHTKQGEGKKHLYLLHDRFFNIWFLMHQGRKDDKNRVLWLIRFLENWCNEDQLKKRTQSLISDLSKGEYYPTGAYLFTTALYYAEKHDLESRYDLARETERFLQEKDTSLHEQVQRSDMGFFSKAMKYIRRKEFEAALKELQSVKNKDPQNLLLMSALYHHLDDQEKADTCYQEASRMDIEYPDRVMGNIFCDYIADYKLAEKYYKKAIHTGDIKSLRYLGWMYESNIKDYAQAEVYYRQAIDKGDHISWSRLGYLYKDKYQNFDKAEEFYLKAAEEGHVESLRYLGWMYESNLKDFAQAEVYYRQAIDKGDHKAYNALSWMYFENKNHAKKALVFVEKGYQKYQNNNIAHTFACVLLWNNQIDRAKEIGNTFMYDSDYLEDNDDYLIFPFLLMAKKEYEFLYKYFTGEKGQELQLKDRFKPVWYALMHHMKEEHPNEYLRMPPELQETVAEIIAKVEQMRIDYA